MPDKRKQTRNGKTKQSMLSINTNQNSIMIQNQLNRITDKLVNCTVRLSTGQKLNSAKDDAAGLYLSSGLTPRISALTIGINAAQTGKNISDIASGAITNMQNAFLRIRDLAVQASSDYYTQDARTAMQNEVNSLIDQIKMTKDSCNFNGVNLLNANSDQLTIDDFDNITTTTLRGTSIQTGEISGTTYYLVENTDQLRVACDGQNGENFVLLSDIDLSGVTWGSYTNNAIIDGNGHIISNLIIDTDDDQDAGFVIDNNGTIKNLIITSSTMIEWHSCGGIAGHNRGTIENCHISNCIISGHETGGIAGDSAGTISNCSVTASNISGNGQTGGIVGYSNNRIDSCCVKDSSITGGWDTGGICGRQFSWDDPIINCYAVNNEIESTSSGLILGDADDFGIVLNSFSYSNTIIGPSGDFIGDYDDGYYTENNYHNSTSSSVTDDYATYKTNEWFASKDAATTLGSAFKYDDGDDYPTLLWEKSNAPSGNSSLRIQTGYDDTTKSYLELNLGFDLGAMNFDISSANAAANSISIIDNYLTFLNEKQSIIGKDYNRLESAAQSNSLEIENMAAAKSVIVDADIAKEQSKYIKNQILQSAATTLLAQTNNINSQIVLGLLKSL